MSTQAELERRPARAPAPADAALRTGLSRAMEHLTRVQWPSGCWEAEMVWCPIITAQYVVVRAIAKDVAGEFSVEERRGLIQQFRATRTREGVWGLHLEADGYVFVTAMSYVALRLLGVPADDDLCATARRWLRAQPGGILSIPSWGKFWLAMIGLYGYEGVNPFPPELYILPEWVPIHPNNYYCHTRYIYMGIAYLYGRRFRTELPLTSALRTELYGEGVDFEAIDFGKHRHHLAPADLYVRPSGWLRAAYDAMVAGEKVVPRALRQQALTRCLERIRYEQTVTKHQGLSPVNGLLNCLALWAHDPADPQLAESLRGLESWRWPPVVEPADETPGLRYAPVEEEGLRYAGAHSTAWDTAFVLRAGLEAPAWLTLGPARESLRRGYGFLRQTQKLENVPGWEGERRDPTIGGWCFSDGVHGWAVSDCTAEALSGILALHCTEGFDLPKSERISDDRLLAAAGFILSRQNDDGGFGTYERRRAGGFMEAINPSEMYGNCMTERSYIECTSSCIGALGRLLHAEDRGGPLLSPELRAQVRRASERGAAFLRTCQRPDGGFAAFWGVNYTYAAFHVTEGLLGAGALAADPTLVRLRDWLLSVQRADGGWGEHYTGCLTDRYVPSKDGQATMTAWALIALTQLIEPGSPTWKHVERGIAFLLSLQKPDGDWPRQGLAGVFFGTAMLDYRLYKNYFPLWALARAASASGASPPGVTSAGRLQ